MTRIHCKDVKFSNKNTVLEGLDELNMILCYHKTNLITFNYKFNLVCVCVNFPQLCHRHFSLYHKDTT